MLSPKKLKFRKPQRGKMGGPASRGITIAFGEFGIKSLGRGWVSARELEAARRAMTRYIRRTGQVWIRVFPDKPITNHGSESVMGSGKGAVDHFVCVVRPGQVLFEMAGVPEDLAREAMRLASHKLSVSTKFVMKDKTV